MNVSQEARMIIDGYEGSFLELNSRLNEIGFFISLEEVNGNTITELEMSRDLIIKRRELFYFKKVDGGELSVYFKRRRKGIDYSAETPVPKTLDEIEIQVTWVSTVEFE